MNTEDFFNFRYMVSNTVIKTVYVLGVAAIAVSGLVALFSDPFTALVGFVIGNGLWRLFCEGVVLMFSIHEVLLSIDRKLEK